jgi:hypothetical protein
MTTSKTMPKTSKPFKSVQERTLLSPRGVLKTSVYYSLFFRVINQQGRVSPRMAIKAACLDCVGLQRQDVTECQARLCPLWKFRPYQKTHGGLGL